MLFYFAVYDYNFYNFLIVFINLDPKNGKSIDDLIDPLGEKTISSREILFFEISRLKLAYPHVQGPLNRVCPLIAWKLYPMSSDKLKGEIVAHEIKLARYRSNLVSDSLFSLLTNTMQHALLPPKFLLKLSINRASQRKCSSSLPILSGKWNSVRSVIRYGVSSGEILWGNGDLFVFRYRRMIAVNLE